MRLGQVTESINLSNFIGTPKATLRQPGFSSDFAISKRPNLIRDKENFLGVNNDVEMPPYTLHTTVRSDIYKDAPMQRQMAMPTTNIRYLDFD